MAGFCFSSTSCRWRTPARKTISMTLGDVFRPCLAARGAMAWRSLSSGADLSRSCILIVLGPNGSRLKDMTTVRHVMGDYVGRFKPMVRDGVPKLWRRWPVDVVVQQVPPPPLGDSGTEWEPLHVTGADLYGAPEADETIDQFDDVELRPLTWRGALYLVEALLRILRREYEQFHNSRLAQYLHGSPVGSPKPPPTGGNARAKRGQSGGS